MQIPPGRLGTDMFASISDWVRTCLHAPPAVQAGRCYENPLGQPHGTVQALSDDESSAGASVNLRAAHSTDRGLGSRLRAAAMPSPTRAMLQSVLGQGLTPATPKRTAALKCQQTEMAAPPWNLSRTMQWPRGRATALQHPWTHESCPITHLILNVPTVILPAHHLMARLVGGGPPCSAAGMDTLELSQHIWPRSGITRQMKPRCTMHCVQLK